MNKRNLVVIEKINYRMRFICYKKEFKIMNFMKMTIKMKF